MASGFPIDPPRQTHALEEASEDSQGRFRNRASHSGPLVHRSAWTKARKNEDDAPKISTGADLSALSGLVAARRNLLSDDRREKLGTSQLEATQPVGRLLESGNGPSESTRKHERMSQQKEDGRIGNNDPILVRATIHLIIGFPRK